MNHPLHFPRAQLSPRRRWWVAALITLAIATSGCVIVAPIPTAYNTAGSRRNVASDTAKQFVPKCATMDDVVLALGEPDEAAEKGTCLIYRWERVKMQLVSGWVIPLGNSTMVGEGWTTTYSSLNSLRFEFDASGVLQSAVVTKLPSEKTEHEFLVR